MVERLRPRTRPFYRARCPVCGAEAELEALLYRDGRPEAARLSCPAHGDVEPFASCDERQTLLFQRLSGLWMRIADQENLWTPPLYRRHAERGASLPPRHSPRALLALAALLRAINESREGRLRDLFFLAFTSMFLELYPPTAGVAEPPLRVEYNVVQSFGRHVRRLARRLHRLAPHWSQHAGRAQLVLRRQPGLDLSDWPDRHGALVYLDLSHLTRVSPLALPSLWADGFRADPAGQDSDVRFFPRRPPFTPDLERLGPDPLEVVCAELSRVTEHGGHLFLSCGGVTEQGMVRVLAALQRAGLDVKGPFDLSEWMPHWRNRSPRPRPPALLYARKPPARSRARAG
ncbi:hypothetical protein HS125_00785 [bacterium]|nr:hypothetical protein [bacterium]